VCFEDTASANRAIEATKDQEKIQGIRFAPKDKKDFQKVFNNIYVKSFPEQWTEEDIRKVFSAYGDITSVFIVRNANGAFAFVCYGKEGADRNYGYECAKRAVQDLHGKPIDATHTWYVKAALTKVERDLEKRKDMIRYKNSKKRCNLYVKNFPPTTTQQ
jgi:polyadenylate-binding protein